eukprot:505694_1
MSMKKQSETWSSNNSTLRDNVTLFDDHTCSFMTFNANYANKVNINVFEEYGASQTIWNVENAKSVVLTVRGHDAFIETELKATNVDNIQINLASNMNEYAISENQWYNCY